jgi:hypothetical protein
MGSALCFPVEAMVFYTLIQSAMHQLDGRRPSSRSIRNYSKLIDIYGDDIIVPVEYTDVVVRYLESYLLKVNVNKSFSKSNFRESCGADYYKGVPVNPVYARTVMPDNLRHWGAEEVLSWNATADLFYLKGKWHIAQVIRDLLSRVVRRTIPRSKYLGAGLVHFSFNFTTDLRWNRDLQCFKQKRLHYDPVKRKDSIDGDELACLNKWGLSVRKRQTRSLFDQYTDPDYSRTKLLREMDLGDRKTRYAVSGDCERLLEHRDTMCRQDDHTVGLCHLSGYPEDAGIGNDSSIYLDRESGEADSYLLTEDTAARQDWLLSERITALEEVQQDPLNYLDGRSDALDFLTSVKRGSFKSKCRWVSLAC